MTLSALVLAAVLATARAPSVDPVADRPRLEAVAAAITAAAETADGAPFTGPARREAAALALVAIGTHESGWRASVGDCRVRGDAGRSVSYWQIMSGPNFGGHTRAELCAHVDVAAVQALAVVRHAAAHSSTPGGLFALYAGAPGRAARDLCAGWERLAQRAGLVGAVCGVRRAIERGPEPEVKP